MVVSYSMITHNVNGWYQLGSGSGVSSLGNNHIVFNNTSVGTLGAGALQ